MSCPHGLGTLGGFRSCLGDKVEGWIVGRNRVAAGLLGEVTVETGWKLKTREGDVDDVGHLEA